MSGSIGQGYLRAEAHYQEQEELAEAKKMQKLTESLRELEMKQLVRGMQREGKEWEYQDRVRREKEGALEKLRASGVNLDYLLAGLKEPEEKEQPYPWMGTPYEEVGARRQFYIKPEKEEKPSGLEGMDTKGLLNMADQLEGENKQMSLDELLAGGEPEESKFAGLADSLRELGAGQLRGQFQALTLPGQETELENLNMGGIGPQPAGTVTEEDEGRQINYEGLAKRLKERPGIKTKQTLESFKEQLLGQYPSLKWETLKTYFD